MKYIFALLGIALTFGSCTSSCDCGTTVLKLSNKNRVGVTKYEALITCEDGTSDRIDVNPVQWVDLEEGEYVCKE